MIKEGYNKKGGVNKDNNEKRPKAPKPQQVQYMDFNEVLGLCKGKIIKDKDCCECEHDAIQKYSDLYLKTECFRDVFFKNLTFEDIAQLAKKSIRLTDDNNSKRHLIDDICELLNCEENEIIDKIKNILTNN